MKEVSCRIFDVILRSLDAKHVDPAVCVAGLPLSIETLRNKNARIDWAEMCAVMKNLRTVFTDAEYVEMGRSYFRSPALRFAFVIARLLLTPMGFYRWLNKPREGAGNQMFTCVVPTHREISDSECEVDLVVPPEYEVCWEFYVITCGNFEEMPRLLGYPAAKVTLERLPQGGRFHITIPKRTPILTRIRRALTWPFTVRAAARELQEAHETLQARYTEIDAARAALERQRALLDTAYRIGQRIWSERDPTTTAAAIANALVEIAGFAGASVEAAPLDTSTGLERATAGRLEAGSLVTLGLSGRSHLAGEVKIALANNADVSDAQTLVDLLAPTIALALANAFAYRSLAAHQRNLEETVDRRTVELRQARDQLAATVIELRDAQGARERFFGNISHEIRTPLSLILLAVADVEARAGDSLDRRARAGLGAVTDAARKLVRLVDELLLLAAGKEDKLRTHPEPVEMVVMLENLASAWRPAAENSGLELHTVLPARLVANVDPVAIERVATNLVSNAVKYTPRGGRVSIELAVEVDGLRLSVFDTGSGIPDELAGRLFGRFERGEDHRKVGTGIGLSLAKQLVEAHGGTIDAHARKDSPGSELRVLLPLACIMTDAAAPPKQPQVHVVELVDAVSSPIEAGTRLAPQGVSQGTVLVAEDDARLAEAIARLLADEYTVVVAHDGNTALELVRSHQPQLLITDIDMPGLNGIELSRRFRDLTGDKLAPIIILSAMLDLRTRVAGLEAGAIDYITKPFDPIELKARLRAQFRMRELALRLHRAEQISALGILTSGLAHELRNPANGVVNAIAPLAQLLPTELTAPETPVAQLLEVIETCSEQIAFLSRQLLGFRNGLALEKRPAELGDLVQRAISFASHALNGVDVRIDLACDGTLLCAPPLITQALTNLIENAAQAAGRGGWVEIRACASGDTLAIEIGDSGPGVPPALRDRVFEPFFTTKPSGTGTGLGLPLARDIVGRHHGTLEIREHGDRSVFVLELPRSGLPGDGKLERKGDDPAKAEVLSPRERRGVASQLR